MLVFDIETDGLLRQCREILCMAMGDPKDPDKGILSFDSKAILSGVSRLQMEETLVGHNIIAFDIPAIQKFYPVFKPTKVVDTLVLSRLMFPDIDSTPALVKLNEKVPANLKRSHSLEAWGYRLGILKGDFGKSKGLEAFTRCSYELMRYNEQDVRVTMALYGFLTDKPCSAMAAALEHDVAWILARQERFGFTFDMKKAWELYGILNKRKDELYQELTNIIPPWEDVEKTFVPKVDNARYGYKKGIPVCKMKVTPFNPGSRDHIARLLKERFGWEPEVFTDTGKPMIDEGVLKPLPWKEAVLCAEYLLVVKRLGQLADGTNGWLRMVDTATGKIHGSVITNGAVTGRMTHHNPNMAQVPAVGSPYGAECRSLFVAPPKRKLIGCDAAALELRCLAHFMYPYDDGAYATACVHGKKEEGTDIHTLNMKAIAPIIEPCYEWTRDDAKTWFYAYIYGAGDIKLGLIITKIKDEALNRRVGRASRSAFESNLPALGKLQAAVKKAVLERGYLIGLDKRILHVRSPHSALNTLLQSAGALVMKKALCILDEQLKGIEADYEFVANIHDEWQIETTPALADLIGKMAKDSIRLAGDFFGFKCPLDGDYRVGNNWKETH